MGTIPITADEALPPFRLSIRITHPVNSPDVITKELGCKPSVQHEVGAQRKTPKGNVLPGVYKESYWLLKGWESDRLEELLTQANCLMQANSDFIDEITRTGGQVEYFIGCFANTNIGATINAQMLNECGRLGITISLDIYGSNKGA